jgi:hypothetical protein
MTVDEEQFHAITVSKARNVAQPSGLRLDWVASGTITLLSLAAIRA